MMCHHHARRWTIGILAPRHSPPFGRLLVVEATGTTPQRSRLGILGRGVLLVLIAICGSKVGPSLTMNSWPRQSPSTRHILSPIQARPLLCDGGGEEDVIDPFVL
jgi:hypothetical protein